MRVELLIDGAEGAEEQAACVSEDGGETRGDAVLREKDEEIKRWRRAKKVALIESLNPEWKDLSGQLYRREIS